METALGRSESYDTIVAEIENDLHSCQTSLSDYSYKTALNGDLSNHFYTESGVSVNLTSGALNTRSRDIDLQRRAVEEAVEITDAKTDSDEETDDDDAAEDMAVVMLAPTGIGRDIASTTKEKGTSKNTEDLKRLNVLRWQLDVCLDKLPLLDTTANKIRNYVRRGCATNWLNRVAASLSSEDTKTKTEVEVMEVLLEVLSASHIAERCFSIRDDAILNELDDKNAAALIPSIDATGKEMIYSEDSYSDSLHRRISRYIYPLLYKDKKTKISYYKMLSNALVPPVLETINVINADTANPISNVSSFVYERDSYTDKAERRICIRDESDKVVDWVVQPHRFDEYDEAAREKLVAVKKPFVDKVSVLRIRG